MFNNGVCTLREIDYCIRSGGKLIGTTTGKKKVILSNSNITSIALLEDPKRKNMLLVNNKSKVIVDYVVTGNANVHEITEIVKYSAYEREISIYIDMNTWNETFDFAAINLALAIKLMCKISGMECGFNIIRYRKFKDITKDNRSFKIIITDNKTDMDKFNKLSNVIPTELISTAENLDGFFKDSKSILKLNRSLNLTCVKRVMLDYTSGNLECSDEFKLWIEAFTKFFRLVTPTKLICMPEVTLNDNSIENILGYLVHEYKNYKNSLSKVKDRYKPFLYTIEDRLVKGTAKEKVDRYIKNITTDYILANTAMYQVGDVCIATLLDYNGFLNFDIVKNLVLSKGTFVTVVNPGVNNNDVKIKIYAPENIPMGTVVDSGYLKDILSMTQALTYSFEYINITDRTQANQK